MRIALSLAKKAGGKVWPNPKVGCVIVNNGRIVGRGYHHYFGGPHAEINALAQAGKKAFGATMYVTLEPCIHVGKTPPCSEAIIKAGIKRVIAATLDQDAKVRGKGLRRLREKSIKTSHGLLSGQAHKINPAYMKSRRGNSTKVIVKAAMSADGKIATRTGDSKWISSSQSRAMVHKLRSNVDAIIVGSNTVLRDDPMLTSHGTGRNPVRVILDSRLKSPLSSRVFDGSVPTIVFFSNSTNPKKLAAIRRKNILTVQMPSRNNRMNFGDVVDKLRKFSLSRVLIEGGGETIASAIDSGKVTDIMFFLSPKIIGGRNARTPVEGLGIARVRDSIALRAPQMKRIGTDFVLTAMIRASESKMGGR
jgi:diaminohydroxyphosphoribosylaminopyrimidine deaminase / 5-amino-6-(5-phosphoribosylamino)uracil reductase